MTFSTEEWDKVLEKGFEAMVQAINTFGPSETLNILLTFSSNDPVVNQLLTKYPGVVVFNEFLGRLPVYENDKVKERSNCVNYTP